MNKVQTFLCKNKLQLQTIGFFTIYTMVFIIARAFREQVVLSFTNRVFLYQWNIPAYIGILLLILGGGYGYMKNTGKKPSVSPLMLTFLLLPLINVALLLSHCLSFGKSMGVFLVYTSTIVVPVYLIYVELDAAIRSRLIRDMLILFDILMVIMALWAIFDYFTGHPIAKLVSDYILTANPNFSIFAYGEQGDEWFYRFTGIWDDSLPAAASFNLWYVLNIIWNEDKMNKRVLPTWLVCILAIAGVCCCNSKTAIVVAAGITLVAFYKDWRMILFAIAAGVVGLASGVLSNVLSRFVVDTSLTSGRVGDLMTLLERDSFYFLTGHDGGCTPGASEFGVIRGAYYYGILFSILLFCLVLGFMCFRLLHKGTIHILLLWGLYFLQMNTFHTGFGCEAHDNMLILCFSSMLILNMTSLRKEHKSEVLSQGRDATNIPQEQSSETVD